MSFQEIFDRWMDQERKKNKGRYMALAKDSKDKDPRMKYKARGSKQPGSLAGARFFFQTLFNWATMDPQDRELMHMAAHCILFIESCMDAFAVEPDVMYDDSVGDWSIYMSPRSQAGGGFFQDAAFMDTTEIEKDGTAKT